MLASLEQVLANEKEAEERAQHDEELRDLHVRLKRKLVVVADGDLVQASLGELGHILHLLVLNRIEPELQGKVERGDATRRLGRRLRLRRLRRAALVAGAHCRLPSLRHDAARCSLSLSLSLSPPLFFSDAVWVSAIYNILYLQKT